MGPEGTMDEVAKPLSMEFEKTWQSGEAHSWWIRNQLDVTPQELWSQWKAVMSGAPQGSVWDVRLMLSDTSVSGRDCGWSAPSARLLGTRGEWCCQRAGGKGHHRHLDTLGPT